MAEEEDVRTRVGDGVGVIGGLAYDLGYSVDRFFAGLVVGF